MASPGVYPEETDLSLYTSIEADTYYGVVGHFSKGPINPTAPNLITSFPELLYYFGKPRLDGTSHAWYACREYLRRGNKLKVVRIESAATPAVASAGSLRGYMQSVALDGPHVTGTSVAAAGQWDDAAATFITNCVKAGDILVVAAPGGDAGYWEVATVALETRLTVYGVTAWPSGGAAGQTWSIYSGMRQSLADGITSTPALRTFTSATGRFGHATAKCNVQVGDILLINDGGTPGDNGIYIISAVGTGVTATELYVNRDWAVGSLAALTYSIYTHIAGGEAGATTGAAPWTLTEANANFVTHGVVAGDLLVIQDTVDTGNNGTYYITTVAATVLTVNKAFPSGVLAGLTFRVLPASTKLAAYYKGTWGDNLEVFVTANSGYPGTKVDIEIDEDGVLAEKWFGVQWSTIVTDLAGSSYVTPTVIPLRGGIPANHDEDFAGGNDGSTGLVDGDVIGTTSGLQLFASAESEQIDILSMPSRYSQASGDALVNLAEARQNCMVLLDVPPWATVDTPQEAVSWSNGGGYGRTTTIASSFAAIYWPEISTYDEYNSVYQWTFPDGFVAGAWANSDKISYRWWAPAGGQRGKVLGVSGMRMTPNQGHRDYMLGGLNCINPIVSFANEGVMLYGQKTCLRATTALNRINTRRMLIWIEQKAAASLRNLVTDPNDQYTWDRVKNVLDPLLRYVKAQRGLTDYLIVCDETNNTAITKANYQLIVEVYIKPTPAAEEIRIRFILTSQSANFQELMGA